MGLTDFLKPSNSIVVPWDHLDPNEIDSFEEQLEAIKRYYQFAKLSTIVDRLTHKKRQGFAAIVFTSARKSLFLNAVPTLVRKEIPFTLFVHDCIGLNRLPLEEEFAAFEKVDTKLDPWAQPVESNAYLSEHRKKVGPLPVDKLDPTRFFVTWGEIYEIDPNLMEMGIYIPFSPNEKNNSLWSKTTKYLSKQAKAPFKCAYSPRKLNEAALAQLTETGIEGIVTPTAGAIEKNTQPLALPCWNIEEKP